MSVRERVTLEVSVVVDVEWLARQFAALTDDAQAQFFCIVAAQMKPAEAHLQASAIGGHLAECECSTDLGRQFVTDIVDSLRFCQLAAPQEPR